jgi:prolyl oligopeptidase
MSLASRLVFPLAPLAIALCISSTAQTPLQTQIHGKSGITLPPPPVVATDPVTDTYTVSGSASPVTVTDPYRWLEDARSPQTRAFIAAENAYTQSYFDQVKILPEIRTQMSALLRVDSTSVPTHRGDWYFFSRRLADQNQSALYRRRGLHGADELLLDANTLSSDGNTSASFADISSDAKLMAYGIRVGGADELEVHFLDLTTLKPTPDVLPSARYYGVQLAPDKSGVYYSRFFPHEGTRVFFHRFGSGSTEADPMIFGKEYKGEAIGEIDGVSINITPNGHYLIFYIGRGVPAKREDILLKDIRQPDAPIVPLVYGIDSRFSLIVDGDNFFVQTDLNAPNRRILRAELGKPPADWKTVIPESKDVLEQANIVGGKLFLLHLHDVKSELTIASLEGKPLGRIDLPGIGAGSDLSGEAEDTDGFYTFQSIITPPTIYHYDVRTNKSEVFYTQKVPFDSAQYELKQVFYTSKDGARVPMFIAGRKGLKRDGTERLLMTGYGGFALSETPTWNPEYAWWMSQGGWFALPNLRGGSEYGESWHKAAMFEHKQNVFDDWYAAAEYLIREHYTSPEHFAIRGRSNGGLLTGASMTQRPDLFGAIWCGYPLLDMLRYQRFLMGRTWTTEYGNAENPADFAYIRAYSPYQNVKPGTKYPAIFFFTGDGDTRVDPMNARKMTPLMQSASASGRPILLHYSIKGGHSAGISQTQLVEDYADEMAFLWTETGSN